MPRNPKGMFRRGPSWYYRDRRGGRDRWVCLGSDFEIACRVYRRAKNGETIASTDSVAKLAHKWLEVAVRVNRGPRSVQNATQRVEKYLVPELGLRPIGRVTADDLRRYRLSLEDTALAPQTVAHILADVRCFLRWCEEGGYIDKAPIPRRLLPRIQERPPDRLTDAEVEALLAIPDPYRWVCRLALGTGCRWGELVRAQASHVEKGMLVVSRTKSGKVRRIPLAPDLLEEIRGRVGRLMTFSSSSSFHRTVRELSGVQRFHVHQLRHTMACRWLEDGGSLPALQEILGHASIITTQRYARLNDEAVLQEAGRVWSRADANGSRTGSRETLSPYAPVAQLDRATVS